MGLNQSGSNLDDLVNAVPSILGAFLQESGQDGIAIPDLGANLNLNKIMDLLPAISSFLPTIMTMLNKNNKGSQSSLLTNLQAVLPALASNLTQSGTELNLNELTEKLNDVLPELGDKLEGTAENEQITQLLAMVQNLLNDNNKS